MKALVLGAGLMGKEAARDLVNSDGVEFVTLADVDTEKAKLACADLHSPKIYPVFVDAGDETQLVQLMRKHDIALNALFYSFNYAVAKAAIAAGVHSVDLGGHIGHVTDRVLELNKAAEGAGVTLIPDLGVAPGMINILSGYGASQLDEVKEIKIYVGGIPVKPDPPLEYNHVFSMEGVFDHYTDPSLIIRNGRKVEVPSLSEIEPIYFEKFGPLEAFHTAGGTSTLSRTFPHLDVLEYKTIRYPGHAQKFQLLVDLNLTRKDYEVEVNGQKIKPRDVFLKVIDPIVDLKGKDDVVLLRVITVGRKYGRRSVHTFEMTTYNDRIHKVTAMARSTAYTLSVVAQMIGTGTIQKRGVHPPETIVPGKEYIKEMAKRGVLIKEKVH